MSYTVCNIDMRLLSDSLYMVETVMNEADLPFFLPSCLPLFSDSSLS